MLRARFSPRVLGIVLPLLVGCSSGDDTTPPPAEDSSVTDDTSLDTGTVNPDTGSTTETAVDDTGEALDSTTADSGTEDTTSGDTGATETGESDTGGADTFVAMDSALDVVISDTYVFDTAVVDAPADVPPAPTCTDMTKNGVESDVDCGGATCPKCANGKTCAAAGDCASGVCTGGTCAAPTCMDTVKNAAETDVDCGGGTCGKCATGKSCAAATDCTSGYCTGGKCVEATCTDAAKNGTESDVDCGGTCAPCSSGKACVTGADCKSGACSAGFCVATCFDGEKNLAETDIDCGGVTTCARCDFGKVCFAHTDCAKVQCAGGTCSAYATSCLAIHTASPTRPSGVYTIDPDGAGPIAPLDVYCDMTNGGGGWTLFYASTGAGALSSGVVTPGSGTYMPFTTLKALADAGTQVHFRTAGKFDTESITSVANTQPIINLRNGNWLNRNIYLTSGMSPAPWWTGPRAVTSQYLWFTCGVPPWESSVGAYPDLYWACNNGGGLHVGGGNSWWSLGGAQSAMEFYVR